MSLLRSLIIFLIGLLVTGHSAFAQFNNGTQIEFGKNRIQYKKNEWTYFRFEKFDTYFYKNGRELAAYVSESALNHIKEIETFYDFQLENRIQFVIYNKQSDFKLSNLGLSSDAQFNTGGSNRITGTKVIIFNEGNHHKIDAQIKAGIAEVIFNQMLYGGSWKDMIKNSALIQLPDWFTKGLFNYLAEDWNKENDYLLKDAILSKKFRSLNRLTGPDAVLAGHSLWNYIAEIYGRSVIPNIVYMTRISKNPESGFSFVLGVTLKSLNEDWKKHYTEKYSSPSGKEVPIDKKIAARIKKNRVYNEFRLSPDGKFAAWSTNQMGQIKLYIYDIEKKKTKRVFKADHKIERIYDYSYPLIAWHPSSKLLTFIYEHKGEVNLNYFNTETNKIEKRPPLFLFEKVLQFSYAPDGKRLILSAVQKGNTDIYVYNLNSNFSEQITKDIYDDLYPSFVLNGSGIIFSSNRPDDTLRMGEKETFKKMPADYDLYLYDYKTKSKVLKRLTETKGKSEIMAQPYGDFSFSYLADNSYNSNRYIARFDSAIAFIDTTEHYRYFATSKLADHYQRSVIMQDVNPKNGNFSQLILYKNKYCLLQGTLPVFDEVQGMNDNLQISSDSKSASSTEESNKFNNVKEVPVTKIPDNRPNPQLNKPGKLDINNYVFTNNKNTTPSDTAKIPSVPDTISLKNFSSIVLQDGIVAPGFSLPKQRIYFRTYLMDQAVTQFDNNFLNTGYQRFTGSGVYVNPGFNGLVKLGTSDVFEDYRIVGGFRLSADLKSNEFFLSYEDRAKRWDKGLMFYRQSLPSNAGFGAPKQLSHQLRYHMKYPLSEVASFRAYSTVRADRFTYLSTDLQNLQRKNDMEYWASGRFEYVFDNTLNRGTNIYIGTRMKIFAEYFNQIDELKNNIQVYGIDVRKYVKIHRNLIWANRFAASTSTGTQKLIYYLGSVDNWLNLGNKPTFNTEIPVPQDKNYAYQALATNLRGFNQNIRNGNSFAVINSEIRWPFFSYLYNRPLKSDLLNTFQLIAFGDIGSAWTGKTPYSEDNSFNTQVIYQKPITVTIKRQQEPIVGGLGWGMRARIAGYFIRADWAWGIDDGEIKPRIFYLSFSLDF